jgi:LysR family transcriptional regulator for metE and metH
MESRLRLEVRHLLTLIALRDTGSLVRAAQQLHLTQSALSHQIKALEQQFGTALFLRKSVPVQFSPAGQRLLTLAEQLIPQLEDAERDVIRMTEGSQGTLRIAVECHTCFDWLMPAMDVFRQHWPDVDLDIVSGFHADPVALLHQQRADLAIVSEMEEDDVHYFPLFSFQIMGLVANDHPLATRGYLRPKDFANDTLITYPVPDDMLDIMRQVLRPAGITPTRRTSELTVAILQLVASRRGIAALPLWAVQSYLRRGYVTARPIGKHGLTGRLFATTLPSIHEKAYVEDFVRIVRDTCLRDLPEIELLPTATQPPSRRSRVS